MARQLVWNGDARLKNYDRQGRPIHWLRYVKLLARPGYAVIEKTPVRSFWVSTVWVGIGDTRFETAVRGDPIPTYQVVRRYLSEAEAREGHVAYVLALAPWTPFERVQQVANDSDG